jgi:hypothetical protein
MDPGQRQDERQSHEAMHECPFCHTMMTEPDYDHALSEFQRTEMAGPSPNVKYKRTMRSVKDAQGKETMDVDEQYELIGDSVLIRAAVAISNFSSKTAVKSKSAAVKLKRGTRRLASRIVQWFNKWVFFVFKNTEEGLTKVTG